MSRACSRYRPHLHGYSCPATRMTPWPLATRPTWLSSRGRIGEGPVGKHRTKIRLLAVITAATLVTSISAAGAQATSYQGSSRSAQATATTSSLAPCTTPLYGPDKDCESTSLVVDRWVTFQPGAQSCTYTQFVDWGDGTSSSHTFTNPIPDQYLIASHAYRPETQTTPNTEPETRRVD